MSDAGVPSGAARRGAAYDGPPPAKKQKTMKPKEPKELTTEYLDLCALNDSSVEAEHKSQDQKLKRLVEALRSKRKIVVVAGAGISVSAGGMFPTTCRLILLIAL